MDGARRTAHIGTMGCGFTFSNHLATPLDKLTRCAIGDRDDGRSFRIDMAPVDGNTCRLDGVSAARAQKRSVSAWVHRVSSNLQGSDALPERPSITCKCREQIKWPPKAGSTERRHYRQLPRHHPRWGAGSDAETIDQRRGIQGLGRRRLQFAVGSTVTSMTSIFSPC